MTVISEDKAGRRIKVRGDGGDKTEAVNEDEVKTKNGAKDGDEAENELEDDAE